MGVIRRGKALWDLLKIGRVVADPAKWKNEQIKVSMVVALTWAVFNAAEAFGWSLPPAFMPDPATVDAMAVLLLAVVNGVLTLTTSDKVGLPDKRPPSN